MRSLCSALVVLGGLLFATARAQNTNCKTSGTLVTCTYAVPGTTGSGVFTVPNGVTALTITALGGSGGDSAFKGAVTANKGGLGAVATLTAVSVEPGDTFGAYDLPSSG